ncbi:hypothetical protein ABW19_dt0209564 [Dactylella cylindrospora]|nr:hypothetical protein ABW19_dt0209564 [Dactylella cylindrospora]
MVMQPAPFQPQMPFSNANPAMQDNQQPATPQVNNMDDLKSIPCPYLKNKGQCRFNESRCRYTHSFPREVVDEDTEEELSFDKLPSDSVQDASPQTQNTTPPQAKPVPASNNAGKNGHTRKPYPPRAQIHGRQHHNGYQANGKSNSVTLNPPSKLYSAYEAERLPDDQVYRIVNRKNPLDEALLSYSDEKTGQRVTRSNIREIRFEKAFGRVFDVHLQTITSRDNLAQNLSYLSVSNASGLTDEAIFGLGIYCNPKVIILTGAFNITDAAFLGLCINCKGLEYLEVTGYDNKMGRLTSSSLRMLLESPTVAPALKEIVVKHQAISSQVALELSRARPSLAITTGTVVPGTRDVNIYLWCAGNLAFVNNFVVQ